MARRRSLVQDPVDHVARARRLLEARRERTRDGLRLRFEPADDLLAELAAFLEQERRCCPFLCFTLVVEADEIELTISARGGAELVETALALLETEGETNAATVSRALPA